jgi:hypothetical protein
MGGGMINIEDIKRVKKSINNLEQIGVPASIIQALRNWQEREAIKILSKYPMTYSRRVK